MSLVCYIAHLPGNTMEAVLTCILKLDVSEAHAHLHSIAHGQPKRKAHDDWTLQGYKSTNVLNNHIDL